MDPNVLAQWEQILTSPVAVLLLLLAGLTVVSGSLLAAVRVLWRRNQQLEAEFRGYLLEQDSFAETVRNAQELLELRARRRRRRTPPATPAPE